MIEKAFIESTLVCVTDQKKCENLIIAGRKIADRTKTNLYVINVNNDYRYGKKQDPEAIEHLYNVSKENKAVMNVVYGEEFLDCMVKSVEKYVGINVLTGMPENESSVLTELWRTIDFVDFYMVNTVGKIVKVGSSSKIEKIIK